LETQDAAGNIIEEGKVGYLKKFVMEQIDVPAIWNRKWP